MARRVKPGGWVRCKTCHSHYREGRYRSHIRSRTHKAKLRR